MVLPNLPDVKAILCLVGLVFREAWEAREAHATQKSQEFLTLGA
jgi:hypothetical protein